MYKFIERYKRSNNGVAVEYFLYSLNGIYTLDTVLSHVYTECRTYTFSTLRHASIWLEMLKGEK